jgi:hypothetical protein
MAFFPGQKFAAEGGVVASRKDDTQLFEKLSRDKSMERTTLGLGNFGFRKIKTEAAPASTSDAAPAPTPTSEPTPTPAPEPTPISTAFLGAINRSSGDTGTAALNQGAVTRASMVGTPIGKLVSSIDGSRPRSILGGIVKQSGDLTSNKVIDTSGL